MPIRPHICVCVCTYKRPHLLGSLLSRLDQQETEGFFWHSIVVVDNDRDASARTVAHSLAQRCKTSIRYDVESEQNIALARNRAVRNATGDFIALIDDDELPSARWLLTLYKAITSSDSDGVLGPVVPSFEVAPPRWVLQGRFFDRPAHKNGHVVSWTETRTGNAMLRAELFEPNGTWFDPAFGSGGEDRDFFRRHIERGRVFTWCNDAAVLERVPPTRWKRTVLLKRALLRGQMALTGARSRPMSILTSAIAIPIYAACLPAFLLVRHHLFMECLIRACDHLGKISASVGVRWIRQKYVRG